MAAFPRQRFLLGRCLITPLARRHLADALVHEADVLARHAAGDWGELDPDDARENEVAVRRGFRILSSYPIAGDVVWVETTADRAETVVYMRDEY